MIIKHNGHSCFSICTGDYTLVIDPYTGVPGYPELKLEANDVFASHGHGDHSYFDAVKLIGYEGERPVSVRTVSCFHDECGGAKRGNNLIHIFGVEGMNVVHLGDLGHLLSDEQVREIGPCDVLMIPVGGFYTIDGDEAFQVYEQIKPRIVIPMHYRYAGCGYDVIGGPETFLKHFTEECVIKYDEPCMEVTPETKPQAAFL